MPWATGFGPSLGRPRLLERVRVLEEILDAAGVEDFSVMTDVSVTLVATDVLRRSGWIDSLG